MFSVCNCCCIKSSKHFIDQYNWKDIDFPTGVKDWEKFVPPNTKTINLAYKSIYNRKRKNQVVLLMIPDDKQSDEIGKWHYIALKSVPTDNGFNRPIRSLSRFFRRVTGNDNGDFYCLDCLHSFRTDNVLKKHERLCNCVINMIIVI